MMAKCRITSSTMSNAPSNLFSRKGAKLSATPQTTPFTRHDPQQIDMEFIEWLGENSIPFAIIFTKADKLSVNRGKERVKAYLNRLQEQWEELPPYFISSAEKKTGRDEILHYIEQINRSIR